MQGLKRIPLWLKILFVLALLGAVGAVLSIVPSNKIAVAPADPYDLGGRLRLDNQKPEPAHGHLFLVGVSETRVPVLRSLILRFEPTVTLLDRTGGEEQKLQQARDRDAIRRQQEIAAAAAFRQAGLPVEVSGSGAVVVRVDPKGPSARVIRAGDRIVTVDGSPARTSYDVVRRVTSLPPGTRVTLGVRRSGLPRIVRIRTAAPPEGDRIHRSVLGLSLNTARLRIQLPRTVKFDTAQVVGPSAGLAFALAIYDAESPDDLLQGRYISATGALSLEGEVLPVGAIRQKAIAAQREGHDVLMVPNANVRDAVDAIQEFCVEGDKCAKVLGVGSVEEAISFLKLDPSDLEAEYAN